MKRLLTLLYIGIALSIPMQAARAKKAQTERAYWCSVAYRIASPVLENMAKGQLKTKMQTEYSPHFDSRNRNVLYMECFGRLMTGLAPWLSLPDDGTAEGKQRSQLRDWALASYRNAVDPASPDYLSWGSSAQNLVDAAFIAESFLRGYDSLWLGLDTLTQHRYLKEFRKLRSINPPYNNWLLFSSTIESFMAKAGAPYDDFRVTTAIRKIDEWYVGDGWYSDGPAFSCDYYDSYVIQPMYLETLQAMIESKRSNRIDFKRYHTNALWRCQRYAVLLERFISPEGTFPAFGRSIPYRLAALQPLSLLAWHHELPSELSNGQVRAALTKALHRMFDTQQNFNEKGYLNIGFCGHQPSASDYYTNNGSTYLTSVFFLPLGLPASDAFWTDAQQPWTQVKAWGGEPFPRDHRWADTPPAKH